MPSPGPNTPGAGSGSGSAGSGGGDGVDFEDIKAWIAEQESNPKPLTEPQRKAVADLKISIAKILTEPDIGTRDWVSLLHRYRDAHKAVGADVEFQDAPTPSAQWTCVCMFKGASFTTDPSPFPKEGAGFVVDGRGIPSIPCFASKKKAKQYAAKCCVEWLMGEGYMPRNGVDVIVPKPKPQPAQQPAGRKGKQVAVSPGQDGGDTTTAAAAAATAPPAKPPADPVDVHDDEVPASERAAELCQRLGFLVPQYRIKPEKGSHEFFGGFPDFGSDAVSFPDDLGLVSNCFSRKGAKERIAEEVLKHLLKIQTKRDEMIKGMMMDVAPLN